MDYKGEDFRDNMLNTGLEKEIFGDSLLSYNEFVTKYLEKMVKNGMFSHTLLYNDGSFYVNVIIKLPAGLTFLSGQVPLKYQAVEPSEFNESVLDDIEKSEILNPDKFEFVKDQSFIQDPFLSMGEDEDFKATLAYIVEVDEPDEDYKESDDEASALE